MNPIFEKIFGAGLSGVGDLFSKIVGTFKLSPEKAAELTALKEQHVQELAKLDLELQQRAMDYEAATVQAASANIRAETTSADRYTSRARPSFIYVMLVLFVYNYIVAPLLGKSVLLFPDALFWLFGSCMLGYTAARSWEKILGMPGESRIELGPIKSSNVKDKTP